MKRIRYAVEYHTNTATATLHLEVKVPRISPMPGFDAEPMEADQEKFLESLRLVKGLQCACSNRHSITLTRGGVFEWSEVIRDVLGLIAHEVVAEESFSWEQVELYPTAPGEHPKHQDYGHAVTFLHYPNNKT